MRRDTRIVREIMKLKRGRGNHGESLTKRHLENVLRAMCETGRDACLSRPKCMCHLEILGGPWSSRHLMLGHLTWGSRLHLKMLRL